MFSCIYPPMPLPNRFSFSLLCLSRRTAPCSSSRRPAWPSPAAELLPSPATSSCSAEPRPQLEAERSAPAEAEELLHGGSTGGHGGLLLQDSSPWPPHDSRRAADTGWVLDVVGAPLP